MLLSDERWRQYLRFITSHPLSVIGSVLLITVFFAFQASQLTVKNTRDIWLPNGNPVIETTRAIEDVFGGHDVIVIGVSPVNGDIYQPAVLEKIARLQEKILRIPEAVKSNVVSIAARKVKAIRASSDSMEVSRLFTKIPRTPEEIKKLKNAIADNPLYIGSLISEDARFAAVIADFKLKKDANGYAALYASIEEAVNSERGPEVNLFLGGSPVNFATMEQYTAGPLIFGVAFLVIMLIQYWSFRSIQGMLLPMVTAILSVVWGLGIIRFFFHFELDPINTITPILIMAITSGHGIQLLKRYYEEYKRLYEETPTGIASSNINKQAVIESIAKVGSVMVAAGLIATITFYSLGTSDIALVRHFGFFAGSGVLSGLIIEMSVIPALRSLLRPPRQYESKREASIGLLDRILLFFSDNVSSGRAHWILIAGVAIIFAISAGIYWLRVDNSTMRYLAPSSIVRSADRTINSALGGTNTIYFLVEGKQPDSMKDPRVLMGMERLQLFLDKQPDVGKSQSLADFVKRMNRAMHNDDPAYSTIPQDSALVGQYLFFYTLSGDPDDFSSYVDNDYQKALVWVFVKNDSTAYAQKLIESVRPILEKEFPKDVSVRIGGTLADTGAINDVIVREKIINTIQMGLVIFLLTSLMLRSFVGGLFVVMPVLIIVVANFGIMGWLGIPLDMGTATTASMAIGIGADYEIYLLYRFREELSRTNNVKIATQRSLQTSGKAILFVAMAVAGGYSVLLTSDFLFYSRLANAVIMTMVISAFSAIIFLRAMMLVFRPRFVFGEKSQAPVKNYASSES